MERLTATIAAILGALAVILGAFGAHALRTQLDAQSLDVWHTAVEYQFWHALALLLVGLAPASRWRTASTVLLLVGTAVFCSSLYAIALGAAHTVGIVTPFGGLALICGWLAAAVAFWRTAR